MISKIRALSVGVKRKDSSQSVGQSASLLWESNKGSRGAFGRQGFSVIGGGAIVYSISHKTEKQNKTKQNKKKICSSMASTAACTDRWHLPRVSSLQAFGSWGGRNAKSCLSVKGGEPFWPPALSLRTTYELSDEQGPTGFGAGVWWRMWQQGGGGGEGARLPS